MTVNEEIIREGNEDFEKVKEVVSIDPQACEYPGALNQELINLPGEVARWGFRAAHALADYNSAKQAREEAWALAGDAARAHLLEASARPTVAQIEGLAIRTDTYRAAAKAESDAEVRLKRYQAVMEALRAKREALITLGANLRSELQSGNLHLNTTKE